MAVELWAYADESGLEENPKYCLIAGYIANPRQWMRFEREWKKVLGEYSVQEFHAIDFFHRKPPRGCYKGWSEHKAKMFLGRLLAIIGSTSISPIGAIVDVADFKANPEGVERFLTGAALSPSGKKWMGNTGSLQPYHLAFALLLTDAAWVNHNRPDVKIHFTFDIQNIVQKQAVKLFDDIVNRKHHQSWQMFGRRIFSDGETDTPLQAADLHAYLQYCYVVNKNLMSQEQRRALRLASKDRLLPIWNQEQTEGLLARYGPNLKQQLRDKKS
ncbi:MAG: hypothetical protein HY528_00970 [Chloroflexi bacterium]|nr:hypothetical protein [Chloroflexota bacterium]